MKAGIKENDIDLIISNCVVNLCHDKEKALTEAFNVLKEGGEMYFSDIYSDKRIPDEYKKDAVLWGEWLSGAQYINDFIHLCKKIGFRDPRLVKDKKVNIKS